MRPVDALPVCAIVIVATLHVRVVTNFDPWPCGRVHFAEIAYNFDRHAGRHLHVVISVRPASRITLRKHSRYNTADVDFLIAL